MNRRTAVLVVAVALILLVVALATRPSRNEVPADPAAAWNEQARAAGERRERAEAAARADGERAVAREKLRIYQNCMQTAVGIKQCADLAGIRY